MGRVWGLGYDSKILHIKRGVGPLENAIYKTIIFMINRHNVAEAVLRCCEYLVD